MEYHKHSINAQGALAVDGELGDATFGEHGIYMIGDSRCAIVKFTAKEMKAEATAPTTKTGLTYTGSDQQLIKTAGTATNGTMMYSLSENGTYTDDITTITAKNAGTYTVYYYAKGDDGYTDSAKKSVTVKIAKADQPVKVTSITKTVKKSKVRKGKCTITGAIKVTGAKGKVTYKKVKTNNYAYKCTSVNKTSGKITMKKHNCKSSTKKHTIKVKVSVAETANYKAYTKTVKVVTKMK